MATAKRAKVTESDVVGLKYFDKLMPLLSRLRDSGCARDKVGNRTLHFDQYCTMELLFLFNPVVRSLRAIQHASELQKVQKKLGCAAPRWGCCRSPRMSSTRACSKGITAELGEQLRPLAADPRLRQVRQTVTLVGGTPLKALPRIAEAMWLSTRTGTAHHAWRLHTHFDLDKRMPTRTEFTDGRNSGPSDNKAVLRKILAADRSYVMDRWYAQFTLFNETRRAGSSYVCRVRDNSA